MYKVDLHTHSTASKDGGINMSKYQKIVTERILDCVAITDHNRIDFAIEAQAKLGESIIVGEEIMTAAGEIIGLYLNKEIPSGLSPIETIRQIKNQGGIVYIPHPFETVRHGLPPHILEEIMDHIDIIEVYNGRAFVQDRSGQTVVWSRLNNVVGAASSDAHGYLGVGKTYTLVSRIPNKESLVQLLLEGNAIVSKPTVRSLLYPKYHRIRKKLQKNT